MTDFTTWISVLIGIVTLALAYLAYRSQRGKTRLEFVVTVNAKVAIVEPASAKVAVTFDGRVVPDASVMIIRLVNTGDKAIMAADYSTDLKVRLDSVDDIVAVTATRTRPPDLRPQLAIDGNVVAIKPLLINPADLIELQVLASGIASSISVEGRIANLSKVSQRKDLPYPPG